MEVRISAGKELLFSSPISSKKHGFYIKREKRGTEDRRTGREGHPLWEVAGGKGRDPENQSLRSPYRGAWPGRWPHGSRGLRDRETGRGLTCAAQLMRSVQLGHHILAPAAEVRQVWGPRPGPGIQRAGCWAWDTWHGRLASQAGVPSARTCCPGLGQDMPHCSPSETLSSQGLGFLIWKQVWLTHSVRKLLVWTCAVISLDVQEGAGQDSEGKDSCYCPTG